MQKPMFQVSPSVHALLNNEALSFSLFKANFGFRLIFDLQVLPLPRVWIRIPLIGELVLGFIQFEVCGGTLSPDIVGFEYSLRTWETVSANSERVWNDIEDPELLFVCGNPNAWSLSEQARMKALRAWGLPTQAIKQICNSTEDIPTLQPRGLNSRIDSNRYS